MSVDSMLATLGDPRSVSELHLANRSLVEIPACIRTLKNLEVLYLDSNQIDDVAGLYDSSSGIGTKNLKVLGLSGNRLTTLGGHIRSLRYLEVLSLEDNKLRDLNTCLQELRHLKFLKKLNLLRNPLTQELNYRLLVINALPGLEFLDQKPISSEERSSAARVCGARKVSKNVSIAFGKTFQSTGENPKFLSTTFKDLDGKVKKVMQARKRTMDAAESQFYAKTELGMTGSGNCPLAPGVEARTPMLSERLNLLQRAFTSFELKAIVACLEEHGHLAPVDAPASVPKQKNDKADKGAATGAAPDAESDRVSVLRESCDREIVKNIDSDICRNVLSSICDSYGKVAGSQFLTSVPESVSREVVNSVKDAVENRVDSLLDRLLHTAAFNSWRASELFRLAEHTMSSNASSSMECARVGTALMVVHQ